MARHFARMEHDRIAVERRVLAECHPCGQLMSRQVRMIPR